MGDEEPRSVGELSAEVTRRAIEKAGGKKSDVTVEEHRETLNEVIQEEWERTHGTLSSEKR